MKQIYIGTSGWSYKDWEGNFYPEKMPARDYLPFYAKKFSAVEIDSTFYGIPSKATVENWYKMAPPGFKFAPKLPQEITHKSDLTGVDEFLAKFIDTISLLNEKLGPILLQFPYSFGPEMSSNLAGFLKNLPTGFDFVVEIRNRKWLTEKFYDMLRQQAVGLVLLDHPWMPRLDIVTSKTLYIRFLGDRNKIAGDFSHVQVDREADLEGWRRMVAALEEKVDDFYGFFNNHYSGHSPTTARRFREMLTRIPELKKIKSGKE